MTITRTRSRLLKSAVAVVAAVATMVPLSACGGTSTSSANKEIIINAPANATTALAENFNPYSSLCLDGVKGGLYEALFYVNAYGDGTLEPRIGTDYKVSDDAQSVTVTIRDGVKWSDGEDLTADDVVFTYDLLKKFDALNTVGFKGTVEKTGDNEVTIDFGAPMASDFVTFLTAVYIVPQHDWENRTDPVTDTNSEPVSSGPFILKSGDDFTTQSFVLRKNPNYWEKGVPEVDGIRYTSYSSDQSKLDAIAAGNLDWAVVTSADMKNTLSGKPISTANLPSSQVSLITCSNAELGCVGPQTDPAVRKAVYYGIDRSQLNKLAFDGDYTEINGSLYPTKQYEEYYDESAGGEAPMKADQEKAVQLLEDAGYTKGSDGIYEKNGEKLSFNVAVTNGTAAWISAVDIMNQQLKEIGIEFKTQQVSSNEWGQGLRKGDYQFTVYGLWLPDSNEAFGFYNQWYNGAKTAPKGEIAYPGYARYKNEKVDAALTLLNETTDKDKRQEAYSTIQQQVFEDMPYIPILRQSGLTAFWTDKVTGWPSDDNLYANPQPWAAPSASEVLKHLKKK